MKKLIDLLYHNEFCVIHNDEQCMIASSYDVISIFIIYDKISKKFIFNATLYDNDYCDMFEFDENNVFTKSFNNEQSLIEFCCEKCVFY